MSLFKKFFGTSAEAPKDEDVSQYAAPAPHTLTLDERFIMHFRKNGGKFIYCENLGELKEQFLNILEENDWFECEAMCYDQAWLPLLEENKLQFQHPLKPLFFLTSCESLLAENGSIVLSSKQTKNHNLKDLPANMVVVATTQQFQESISDAMREIKRKYVKDYPTITTIKYFQPLNEEDFLQYGSCSKNLYLLLLEEG